MRPPEVFVRELSPEEGSRLKSISRKAEYQSKRQRAVILLASATGMSAPLGSRKTILTGGAASPLSDHPA